MHSEWYNSSVVQHQSLNADARHFFMDQTRIDTILTDLFQESWDSWEYTVTSEGKSDVICDGMNSPTR